ncbi:MAG: ABC transporter permease [Sulfolobales archaeon]
MTPAVNSLRKIFIGLRDFWVIYRRSKYGVVGLGIISFFVFIAVAAPLITRYNPYETNPSAYLLPPSSEHWFGTNEVGQDLFSLNIYGARISLLVGFTAALIAVSLGTLIGLVSGYYGGLIDEFLMRITDFFLVIPPIILMIVIGAVLGPSLINVIIIIGMLSWSPTARVVRSMVLSIKEWAFIEAIRAIGGGDRRIIFRHILPNVASVIYANMALATSNAIFSHAAMVFLGVGNVNDLSWGMILHYAFASGALSTGKWWYFVPPGVFIVLVIIGFVLVGFSLEEIFNPRLRRK